MKKKYDCVEMKHKAAARTQKKIHGFSIDEKLSFWKVSYQRMNKKCQPLNMK